jgi:hypothetical protein
MARKWTPEQRKVASDRAKAQGLGARTLTQAAVDVVDVAPVGRSAEVFAAENERKMEETVEQAQGEDGSPVVTTHNRAGTLVMYKPTESQGYVPRTVSVSAIRLLIRQGWHETCPECHKKHINTDGQESTDPNLCSVRDPVAVRVCPVCPKRIYDNVGFSEQADSEDDPNVIQDDAYDTSTPASRTLASLNLHLWVRHTRQAQMMNVPPLPAAMREMVEEAVPA